MGGTLPSSYGSRLATGLQGAVADGPARPMTAVKGAGFGSSQKGGSQEYYYYYYLILLRV